MFQPLVQQTQTSRCTALHRCTPLLNNIVLVRRTWLAAPVTGSDPDQVYNLAVVSRATDSSSNSTIVPAINTGHPGSVPVLRCDGFRLKFERVSIWPCRRSGRLAFASRLIVAIGFPEKQIIVCLFDTFAVSTSNVGAADRKLNNCFGKIEFVLNRNVWYK